MAVTPFCTDEDIAVRFRVDFEALCNREYMAAGSDGAFLSSDRWTLNSASTDFDGQGVGPGSVVVLKKPESVFGPAGMLYAVGSASGPQAALRRLNMAAGAGLPPGPAAGYAGISFAVPTLAAQIENASYDIERQYGISGLIAGREVAAMFDQREVRKLCVLWVACERYFDLARQPPQGQGGDVYLAKARAVLQDKTDLLDRVVVHWQSVPEPAMETTRFGTRLVR